MSADRICPCPACGEWALREWHEMGMPESESQPLFIVEYRAECRSCGQKYGFSYETAPSTLRTPSTPLNNKEQQ